MLNGRVWQLWLTHNNFLTFISPILGLGWSSVCLGVLDMHFVGQRICCCLYCFLFGMRFFSIWAHSADTAPLSVCSKEIRTLGKDVVQSLCIQDEVIHNRTRDCDGTCLNRHSSQLAYMSPAYSFHSTRKSCICSPHDKSPQDYDKQTDFRVERPATLLHMYTAALLHACMPRSQCSFTLPRVLTGHWSHSRRKPASASTQRDTSCPVFLVHTVQYMQLQSPDRRVRRGYAACRSCHWALTFFILSNVL